MEKLNIEELKTIDDYFGYDIRKTLEEIECDLDELSLTIVMEPHNKKLSHKLRQVFTYKLEDETNFQKDSQDDKSLDGMLKLIERIVTRQKGYKILMNKVTDKLKELQQQYAEYNCKFSIIKRNKQLDSTSVTSDSHSESSCCEENSVPSMKRKWSSEESNLNIDHRSKRISLDLQSEMVEIGTNGTQIKRKDFEALKWKNASGATRSLCNTIFGEHILATHSFSGNQSPAFRGRARPIKSKLDPMKTGDITQFICSKFKVSPQFVRTTITIKCADAAKKSGRKMKKSLTS